jgi:hypothetical protein
MIPAQAVLLAVCWGPGCHRDRSNPAGQAESPATLEAATPPSISVPGQEASRLATTWNDALDRHNVTALEGLYDAHVRFYGRDLPRSAVLSTKRAALGPQSDFHQQILGDIAVSPNDDGSWSATFLKRSGSAGKTRDVRAKLVLRQREGGAMVIVEETDGLTEARKAEGERSAPCVTVAAQVVNDLPEVKREVARMVRVPEKSGGRAHFGGIGPTEDGQDGFTVGIGLHTDERFEGEIWYSVDAEGHVGVTVAGEDLALPTAAKRKVEEACRKGRPAKTPG